MCPWEKVAQDLPTLLTWTCPYQALELFFFFNKGPPTSMVTFSTLLWPSKTSSTKIKTKQAFLVYHKGEAQPFVCSVLARRSCLLALPIMPPVILFQGRWQMNVATFWTGFWIHYSCRSFKRQNSSISNLKSWRKFLVVNFHFLDWDDLSKRQVFPFVPQY